MAVQRPLGDNERDIFIAQRGLITSDQARTRGETSSSIKAKLARGEWAQVTRGIYRATLYPVTPEQQMLAQTLRSPGRTWASHECAAWLHGLIDRLPKVISVTTTGRLRNGCLAMVHHTRSLPPCDVTTVRGVPTTAIERTLLDLAARATVLQLDAAMDEAILTKRSSIEKIEWRLRRAGGQGTPGSAALARCLAARKRAGQVDSHLEREFFAFLREEQLPIPEIQHPIELGSKTVFADFAYPEQHLIVEVMGYRWHGGRERWEKDLSRSSDLAAIGWRMIYVTKRQIREQRRETANRLRRALGIEPLFFL